MLIDLLNAYDYLMINLDAIKTLGLVNAAYCAELLTVYKKVIKKNAFVRDNKFFKIDRKYIEGRTGLSVEEQLKCDLNLKKVDIIDIDGDNPSIISIDIDQYVSLIACEDVKIQAKTKEEVTKTPKGASKASQQYVIENLKASIDCNTPEIRTALEDWIQSLFDVGKGLSKVQVKKFKDTLDDVCNGDIDKALKIIDIATIHSYIDCQWAVNTYNKDLTYNKTAARTTVQKTSVGVNTEGF